MRARGRVRPSKPMSALGLIFGIIMLGIGLAVVIPAGGMVGLLWVGAVLAITGFYAYNLFSEEGAATEVVDFETSGNSEPDESPSSTARRLRDLDELRRQGLVSEDEYAEQRKRILGGI